MYRDSAMETATMEAFFTARANTQASNNRSMQAVGLVTCVFRLGSLLACKQLSRRRKEERTNKIPIQRRPQRPSHGHSTSSSTSSSSSSSARRRPPAPMTVSTLRLPPPPPPPPARHPHALVIVRSDHCAQLGTATNPRPLPFTHGFTRHLYAFEVQESEFSEASMSSRVPLTERVAATLKRHAEDRCHFDERHAKELHERMPAFGMSADDCEAVLPAIPSLVQLLKAWWRGLGGCINPAQTLPHLRCCP